MNVKLHSSGREKMPPPPPRGTFRLPSRKITLVEEIRVLPAAKIERVLAGKWPHADAEDVKEHFARFVETDSRASIWSTWLEACLDYRIERLRYEFGKPIED